jgi:multisubunit Na+/H+ antiporter MnhG subunit
MQIIGLVLIGAFGMLWFTDIFFKTSMIANKNNKHARTTTILISIMFSLRFPRLLTTIQTASPLELFALAGCTLGLIACARSIYLLFLKIERS